AEPIAFVVVSGNSLGTVDETLLRPRGAGRFPLLIVHVDRDDLIRRPFSGRAPDIVLFDDSLMNREAPFGAFVAAKRLYRLWTRRGMTTFHSTTFQPNTISTLRLVNSLRAADPEFVSRHETALRRIERDARFRRRTFADLYSRSLAKLATSAGV